MNVRWLLIGLVLIQPLSYLSCKGKTQPLPQEKKESLNLPPPSDFKQEPVDPSKMLSPLESIKELDHKIENYKPEAQATPEELEANRKLKQEIIRGTFDIYELSKEALDKHWDTLTEADRNYFVNLMTNLLEKKAILSKEQVKGTDKPYRISYLGQEFLNPEKTQALVQTKLFVPSEKIDLDIHYKLKLTPYGWRIYDVIVDEASLVDNYKFQFDTIIKKNGYADLVSRMEKKLQEME